MPELTPPLDLDVIATRCAMVAMHILPRDDARETRMLLARDVPALLARMRTLEAENTLLRRIIHQHGITWFEPATITADDEA